MEINFIEFYPNLNPRPHSKVLGTVHLYIADFKMDLRGIRVVKSGQNLIFKMPHVRGWDYEEDKEVFYPVVNFVDPNSKKEILDYLHQQVKPLIKTILAGQESKIGGQVDPTHRSHKKTQQKPNKEVSTNRT